MAVAPWAMRFQIKAPVAEVFKAWTEPTEVIRWWGPGASAEVDLQTGGAYRYGMVLENGYNLVAKGEYVFVAAPERLAFTFTWKGSEATFQSQVELTFTEASGETELRLIHSGFQTEGERENHAQGWHDCIARLQKLYDKAA